MATTTATTTTTNDSLVLKVEREGDLRRVIIKRDTTFADVEDLLREIIENDEVYINDLEVKCQDEDELFTITCDREWEDAVRCTLLKQAEVSLPTLRLKLVPSRYMERRITVDVSDLGQVVAKALEAYGITRATLSLSNTSPVDLDEDEDNGENASVVASEVDSLSTNWQFSENDAYIEPQTTQSLSDRTTQREEAIEQLDELLEQINQMAVEEYNKRDDNGMPLVGGETKEWTPIEWGRASELVPGTVVVATPNETESRQDEIELQEINNEKSEEDEMSVSDSDDSSEDDSEDDSEESEDEDEDEPTIYSENMTVLQSMGFEDTEANMAALVANKNVLVNAVLCLAGMEA